MLPLKRELMALNPTPLPPRGFLFLIPSDAHPILFDHLVGAGKQRRRYIKPGSAKIP